MTQVKNSQKSDRTFFNRLAVVFGTTVLGAIIAYGSSFFLNKSWIAEAKVERPDVASLGNYYSLSSTYQFIHNRENSLSETDSVYREFTRQLTAEKTIRHFWQTSDYYKQKQTGETHLDLALLEKLITSIQFQMAKPDEFADTIRLELENPKLATELLSSYIDYVNQETRKVIYSNLITQWKVLFERVKKATEFNLGKHGQGMVEPIDWQGKLQMMQAVSPLDEQFTAYRYSKQPTQAMTYSFPNRLNWGIAGAILGFLIAAFFLLSLNLCQKKNKITPN